MAVARDRTRSAWWSPSSVHPEYREVLATYAQNQDMPITKSASARTGASICQRSRCGDHQ